MSKIRLIDANALKRDIKKQDDLPYGVFEFLVDLQPTVDAIPIIRCRRCKYWDTLYDREKSMFGTCRCPRALVKRTRFDETCYWADEEDNETCDGE